MATTQYQVFTRYFNPTTNTALTNNLDVSWISAEDYENLSNTGKAKIDAKIKQGSYVKENRKIRNSKSWVYRRSKDTYTRTKVSTKPVKYEYVLTEYEPTVTPDKNYENYIVEIETGYTAKEEMEFNQVITDEIVPSNPKYDMLFVYDGISTYSSSLGSDDTDIQVPTLYYERMKRIKLDPWFEHSVHGSLRSAMTKAQELADIIGKDNVKVGKIVELDQYLDIV